MSDELCLLCGESAVRERTVPFAFDHGGKKLTIMDRQMVCERCGNISYVGRQISDHELEVARSIREADGLLSAEELRRIRCKYRLRQTDMEQMLSIGPKTWTRWERGKVPQSKAADKLIRLIAEDPDVAHRLMEQAQINNPEAAQAFERIEADAWRVLQALLGVEPGKVRDRDATLLTSRPAGEAFETMRNARREAAARAEAA
jgi:putative zinc finger/helix-turn-helix YgiT family protein